MNDVNAKRGLKALWAVAVCFLCVLLGTGGGGVIGYIIPSPSSRDVVPFGLPDFSDLVYRIEIGLIIGAVVGLIAGIFLTTRVWHWFNKSV